MGLPNKSPLARRPKPGLTVSGTDSVLDWTGTTESDWVLKHLKNLHARDKNVYHGPADHKQNNHQTLCSATGLKPAPPRTSQQKNLKPLAKKRNQPLTEHVSASTPN